MSGKTRRQKLLFGAATVALCGTLAIGMTSEAPLILYPITPSLPLGLYVRTFEPPKVGMIAAFRVPKAAKHYKTSIGEQVHDDFLFMKPIVAGPGDQVCCRPGGGLFINGNLTVNASTHDAEDRKLPVWNGCRDLGADEYLAVSIDSRRSIDGRHFGPVQRAKILGTYRPT